MATLRGMTEYDESIEGQGLVSKSFESLDDSCAVALRLISDNLTRLKADTPGHFANVKLLYATVSNACQAIFTELDMDDQVHFKTKCECMEHFSLGWKRALRECIRPDLKRKSNYDQLLNMICSGFSSVAIAHPLRLIGYANANLAHKISGALSEKMPLVMCHSLCLFFNVPIIKAKRSKIAAVEKAIIDQYMPTKDRLRLILQDMPILDGCTESLSRDQIWALEQLAAPTIGPVSSVASPSVTRKSISTTCLEMKELKEIKAIKELKEIKAIQEIKETDALPSPVSTSRMSHAKQTYESKTKKPAAKSIANTTASAVAAASASLALYSVRVGLDVLQTTTAEQGLSSKFYLDPAWRKRAEAAANDLFPIVPLTDTVLFSPAEKKRTFDSCRAFTEDDAKRIGLPAKSLNTLFRLDKFDNVISLYANSKAPCGIEADHYWPRARAGRTVTGNCCLMHSKVNNSKGARLPMFLERKVIKVMTMEQFGTYIREYGVVSMLGVLPEHMKAGKELKAVNELHFLFRNSN